MDVFPSFSVCFCFLFLCLCCLCCCWFIFWMLLCFQPCNRNASLFAPGEFHVLVQELQILVYGEGPKTWFTWPGLVFSCSVHSSRFRPMPANVVFVRSSSMSFWTWPRPLASNPGAQWFHSYCCCENDSCIRPLGFQSDSNLFLILPQPFVFDFWP